MGYCVSRFIFDSSLQICKPSFLGHRCSIGLLLPHHLRAFNRSGSDRSLLVIAKNFVKRSFRRLHSHRPEKQLNELAISTSGIVICIDSFSIRSLVSLLANLPVDLVPFLVRRPRVGACRAFRGPGLLPTDFKFSLVYGRQHKHASRFYSIPRLQRHGLQSLVHPIASSFGHVRLDCRQILR